MMLQIKIFYLKISIKLLRFKAKLRNALKYVFSNTGIVIYKEKYCGKLLWY